MEKYDVGADSEDYSDEETSAKSVRFASISRTATEREAACTCACD